MKLSIDKHIAAIVLLCSAVISGQSSALEKPEYSVLYQDGKIEYRLYESYLVAETEVVGESGYGSASNEGFMRLFGYISGDNYKQSEIAMTAPVQRARVEEEIAMTAPVQRSSTEQGWRVSFMLPRQYTLESAPVPTDERISIRQIPQRTVATIRYSGRWTESNLEKYSSRLLAAIEAEGLEVIGKAESAAYNPPFMPPFLRRNEILIEVESAPQ